jgi:hypothetical protein
VPMPCSPTPAGPTTPCPDGGPMLPPLCQRRRLRRVVLSRLNRTAWALAVYASSGGLPAQDARLASGCWLGFTGWDWLPTESRRKVSELYSLHLLLLSQASLGAMTLYSADALQRACGERGVRAACQGAPGRTFSRFAKTAPGSIHCPLSPPVSPARRSSWHR